MIVTCPGCASKYRVRNETVPADGARMRCPKCETLFLAKPPDAASSPSEPTTLPPLAVPGASAPSPFAAVPGTGSFGGAAPAVSGAPAPAFGAQGLFGHSSGPVPLSPGAASAPPGPAAGGGLFAVPPTGGGGAPAAARPQGPLTMMMQGIDDATLKAATGGSAAAAAGLAAGPPAAAPPARPRVVRPDEDPFAHIVVDPDAPADPAPAARAASSLPLRVAHTEPTALVRVAPARPSLVAEAASWALVTAASFAALFGVAFAGWTSEALDLDATLLPVFERRFGVEPPRSFAGRDDVPVETLRQRAVDAESAGDLAAAAVAWLELREHAPDDPAVVAAVPRLFQLLGEPVR
jgi:predicted Zn finger-like uncharacterized protein